MDEPTPRPTHDSASGAAPDGAEGDEVTIAEIDQAAALAGSRTERLVSELIEVELETGRREETIEAAKRHILIRIAIVVAGSFLLLLGIAMLVLPGPGFLVIALGLGLLATDVPFARRWLDKVRARLPQDEDGSLPRSTIITMVVVGVVAVGASIALSVWQFSRG